MTARKIKHARALEKREKFMLTVKEGNLKILDKVRDLRAEEEKRKAEELKQQKIEKAKRLAKAHRAKPSVPRCFQDIHSLSARQRRVPSKLSL